MHMIILVNTRTITYGRLVEAAPNRYRNLFYSKGSNPELEAVDRCEPAAHRKGCELRTRTVTTHWRPVKRYLGRLLGARTGLPLNANPAVNRAMNPPTELRIRAANREPSSRQPEPTPARSRTVNWPANCKWESCEPEPVDRAPESTNLMRKTNRQTGSVRSHFAPAGLYQPVRPVYHIVKALPVRAPPRGCTAQHYWDGGGVQKPMGNATVSQGCCGSRSTAALPELPGRLHPAQHYSFRPGGGGGIKPGTAAAQTPQPLNPSPTWNFPQVKSQGPVGFSRTFRPEIYRNI